MAPYPSVDTVSRQTPEDPYTPGAIFRIAMDNVAVRTALANWEIGNFLTWEKALIAMVVELAKHEKEMTNAAETGYWKDPSTFVRPG